MTSTTPFRLARRAAKMNPSMIREILKLTEQPGLISFAGGLPSPKTFPVEAMRVACERVLRDTPQEALQYAASEGFAPLREWVAIELRKQGLHVDAAQVLITTGSQQGLDLLGKVLIDAGSTVLVESPTYLGALQAFAPMEPRFAGVAGDDDGPQVEAMSAAAAAAEADARFFYLLPNFQNPTGRSIGEARRAALAERAAAIGLPLVEDNPYGDLWFDAPPPPSLAGRHPEGVVYLGSFSKVLAPGLRLGYVVAPTSLMPKLLQAKQAADLHTPGFNQRVVYEVIRDGFLDRHVPTIRALYKAQRDAMLAALDRHMPAGVRWNRPAGGMFLWVRLPGEPSAEPPQAGRAPPRGAGGEVTVGARMSPPGRPKGEYRSAQHEGTPVSAVDLLPLAIARGVAFVPGAPFFAEAPQADTLRLSFVTASVEQIETGISALGDAIRALQEARP